MTIIKLGALLFEKFSAQQHDYIRQTMRQLGRLLLQMKSCDKKISSLSEALRPVFFDNLLKAVKCLCSSSFNDQIVQKYGIPSLALKIGHSLRKCAQIVRSEALRKGDLNTDRETKGFMDIMDLEWRHKISSIALKTLHERKINCTEMLPITSDILKLNHYLDVVIETCLLNFYSEVDISQHWHKLSSAVLCRIILFNKRRSGEASRMTLEQYACRPDWKEQCTTELKDSLTSLEKTLANRLVVVEVHGKSRKNFKVPILLTPELKKAVDTLIKTRHLANVYSKNVYVFPRSGTSLTNLRGHDCLKQFSIAADLQSPELITSTKLRKYVATVVQVFDLKESESDWLARHLGHDIRIHRDFYRLHESAVELTKVSRILLAVDSGTTANFAVVFGRHWFE
nr:uncharacterized protein LOC111516064 [Leptinotarsa decemlineata]